MPVFVTTLLLVGAPPSGRFLVVGEAFRNEGIAPAKIRKAGSMGGKHLKTKLLLTTQTLDMAV